MTGRGHPALFRGRILSGILVTQPAVLYPESTGAVRRRSSDVLSIAQAAAGHGKRTVKGGGNCPPILTYTFLLAPLP
jgi:hypothetical protein